MRLAILCLILSAAAPAVRADDPATGDRERRARVALALAATDCGKCVTDLSAAREQSRATGKPLVVFVGSQRCDPATATAAGGIPVRVPSYDRDGTTPPTAARVVVVGPTRDGGLRVSDTLPADPGPEQVRAAVAAARPAAVDWMVGGR